ncbi:DUF3156 family protein [Moellerella wisconsensis]
MSRCVASRNPMKKSTFWQRLNQPRLPAGYQAGITLNRLERDLLPYPSQRITPTELVISLDNQLTVSVTEQVKVLFLAFIVNTRFSVRGALSTSLDARIELKTTGVLRQKKIKWISHQPVGQQIIAQFSAYPVITQTLEQLDFTSVNLEIKQGNWHCEITPFTASELVSRLPASRRYLRLTPEQRHRLLSALQLVSQLMNKLSL